MNNLALLLYTVANGKEFFVASLTIENYVKTVYQTCVRQGNSPAGTGQIANALGVSPGTVTSMLKTLSESGLAEYTPYEGVNLTESGRNLALRVLRRHRLIELFLSQTLELSWDEVHEEAENMEHAVSDHLIDRIEKFLGYPTTDPHGDPIPRADGTIATLHNRSLAESSAGEAFELVRVIDQSPEFLRYLSDAGLSLGVKGKVSAIRREAGVVTIEVAGIDTTIAQEVAEKLLVSDIE